MDIKQNAEQIMAAANKLVPAAGAMEPAEEPQRQIVAVLFPELRQLRNKGFSWTQLAGLLLDCGIYLQPSTIRVYYSEMLDERGEELQRKFTEQLVVLAEINKATRHVDDASLPECATEILAGQGGSVNMSSHESAPELSVDGLGEDHDTPASLVCLPLQAGVKVLPRRPGVDPAVYDSDTLMEHPAIPGLMLSREARVYNAYLEYITPDGEVKTESPVKRNQRIKWEKPAGAFMSSATGSFVKTDPANFKR